MINKVKRYIEENNLINSGDTVIVGVSGGADSVCLLCVLWKIYSGTDVTLDVVHINHGIRETAIRDEEYVAKLCDKLGVPCNIVRIDANKYAKDNGISTEEAGRLLRYEAFASRIPEGANENYRIAVAHNMDDNSETMLLNMFRGTGLKGLIGIPVRRGNIIRPLLSIRRAEIERYLSDEKIEFMTDETNLTDEYTRNKIRHHIMPYATENINDKATQRMSELSNSLALAQDFLENETKRAYKVCIEQNDTSVIINKEEFQKLHPYIKRQLILEALGNVSKTLKDLSAVHIKDVERLFDMQVGRSIDLPYAMTAIRIYEGVKILGQGTVLCPNRNDWQGGAPKIGQRTVPCPNKDEIPTTKYTKWFDYDKIQNDFEVRTRKEGDYIVIDDNGSTQKLKSYFVNNKIPSDMRDSIWLVAKGSEIIWIIGYRISAAYKVTDATKTVCELSVEKDED